MTTAYSLHVLGLTYNVQIIGADYHRKQILHDNIYINHSFLPSLFLTEVQHYACALNIPICPTGTTMASPDGLRNFFSYAPGMGRFKLFKLMIRVWVRIWDRVRVTVRAIVTVRVNKELGSG